MQKLLLSTVYIFAFLCVKGQIETYEIADSALTPSFGAGSFMLSQPIFGNDRNSGKALDFSDPINQVVNWNAVDIPLSDDFTLSSWAYFNPGGSSDIQYIFTSRHSRSGNEAGGISLGLNADQKIFAGLRKINPFTDISLITVGDTLTLGEWHHVVYRKTDTIVNIFVDNVLVGSDSLSLVPNTNAFFSIGGLYNPGNTLARRINGQVDDIRFYASSLSDVEIEDLFNGTALPATPVMHSLQFDNSMLNDEEGNSVLSASSPSFTEGSDGSANGAINFNGSTIAYGKIERSSATIGEDFTIQFSVKPGANPTERTILSNTTGASSSKGGIECRVNASGRLNVVLRDTNNVRFVNLSSSSALQVDAWNQVCITKSGSDFYVVMDSTLEISHRMTDVLGGNNRWTLGAQLNSDNIASELFKGAVDDITFFNTSTSLGELLAGNGQLHHLAFENGNYLDLWGSATIVGSSGVTFDADRGGDLLGATVGANDEIVEVSDIKLNLSMDFTVSLWFYLNAGATDIQYLFTSRHNQNGAERGGLDLGVNTNGNFTGIMRDINTASVNLNDGPALPTGGWQQLIYTRKRDSVFAYINNVEFSTRPIGVEPNSSSFYTIGGMWNPGNDIIRELDGSLDDIQIWQYHLNATERQNIFDNGVITGLFEEDKRNTFSLYPNPSTGTVFLSGKVLVGTFYEVLDITGNLITRGTISQEKSIKLGDYPGAYSIRLTSGRTTEVLKVLKK